MAQLQADNKSLAEDLEAASHKAGKLEKEIAVVKQEKTQMREESNRIETELRRERDKAQE